MEVGFKNISMQIAGYEFEECSCVLPGDLIVEILQRLPVKSLLRFESVSKQWQSVIHNSKFIEEHHNKHKKMAESNHLHHYYHVAVCRINCDYERFALCYCPPAISSRIITQGISLISKGENGNNITSPLSHSIFDSWLQSVSIVGSSNGLVCIKFCDMPSPYVHNDAIYWERCYCLWNPATRKLKQLPRPPRASIVGKVRNIFAGFWYIPSTSTYKLVQISFFKYDEANNERFGARVKVLNIGENSWRDIECQGQDEAIHDLGWDVMYLELTRLYIQNQPVVVNGCMHWLGTLRHGGVVLVSFILEEEVFIQTALPYPFDDHVNCMTTGQKLAVYEDNLVAIVSPDSMIRGVKNKEYCFEVWVFEEKSKSWTKRFSLGPLPGDEHPVGFFGKDEIMIRKLPWDLKPYLYNHVTKEKKNFPCSHTNCNFAFEPYIESLVEIPK